MWFQMVILVYMFLEIIIKICGISTIPSKLKWDHGSRKSEKYIQSGGDGLLHISIFH